MVARAFSSPGLVRDRSRRLAEVGGDADLRAGVRPAAIDSVASGIVEAATLLVGFVLCVAVLTLRSDVAIVAVDPQSGRPRGRGPGPGRGRSRVNRMRRSRAPPLRSSGPKIGPDCAAGVDPGRSGSRGSCGYLRLLFAWARALADTLLVRADERPSRSAADAFLATLLLVTLLELDFAIGLDLLPRHCWVVSRRFPPGLTDRTPEPLLGNAEPIQSPRTGEHLGDTVVIRPWPKCDQNLPDWGVVRRPFSVDHSVGPARSPEGRHGSSLHAPRVRLGVSLGGAGSALLGRSCECTRLYR